MALVTMILRCWYRWRGHCGHPRLLRCHSLRRCGRQVLSRRRPLNHCRGVMLALAAIPGLPKFSFFYWLRDGIPGWRAHPARTLAAAAAAAVAAGTRSRAGFGGRSAEGSTNSVSKWLRAGGAGRSNQGGQLLARVKALRQNLAQQWASSSRRFTSPTTSG